MQCSSQKQESRVYICSGLCHHQAICYCLFYSFVPLIEFQPLGKYRRIFILLFSIRPNSHASLSFLSLSKMSQVHASHLGPVTTFIPLPTDFVWVISSSSASSSPHSPSLLLLLLWFIYLLSFVFIVQHLPCTFLPFSSGPLPSAK